MTGIWFCRFVKVPEHGLLYFYLSKSKKRKPEQVKNHEFIPHGKIVNLHHGSVPCHNAISINEFLESTSISVAPQPPYSPNLSPCDLFLFTKLRKTHQLASF